MNKFISISITLIILLTFVSCARNSTGTAAVETSDSIVEIDYERKYY